MPRIGGTGKAEPRQSRREQPSGAGAPVFVPPKVRMEEVPNAVGMQIRIISKLVKRDEVKLSAIMKMFTLMKVLPPDLASDFLKQSNSFGRSFMSAKRWVLDQAAIRKKGAWSEVAKKELHNFEPDQHHDHCHHHHQRPSDHDHEDLDEVWQRLSEQERRDLLIFGRQKGKGKGKRMRNGKEKGRREKKRKERDPVVCPQFLNFSLSS